MNIPASHPTTPAPEESRDLLLRFLFPAILILGVGMRFSVVHRPYVPQSLSPWREADMTQIMRSFTREGMNILYPRIDWRGDTAGFAEMEFPLLPWTAAVLCKVFGYHEQFLRLLTAVASVLCLLVFSKLAQRLLAPWGAFAAIAFFALNPLNLYLSGAMQPEAWMVLFVLLTVTKALDWSESRRFKDWYCACAFAAAAMLFKSPAAYVCLVLAYYGVYVLHKKAFVHPKIYLGAAIALVPPILWYAWAYSLYRSTGLSLGVSNESHFINSRVLLHPLQFIRDTLFVEGKLVFTVPGAVLALAALTQPLAQNRLAWVWYGSALFLYVLTASTSADPWAFYYHVSSLGPACLLMGSGLLALAQGLQFISTRIATKPMRASLAAACLALLGIAGQVDQSLRLVKEREVQLAQAKMERCLKTLKDHVPEGELILVRGGPSEDANGRPVAYNESMAFVWLDRKGFNYPDDKPLMESVQELARRGGRFWITQQTELESAGIQAEVESRFHLVAGCDGYLLFDLQNSPGGERRVRQP